VQAITAADVRAFFETNYHAGSMVVTMAGPIDHDDAVAMVAAGFVDIRSAGERQPRTAPTASLPGTAIDDDTEQVHIVMGGPSINRGDADREALDVVNHVLGGGLSSRLFEEIRERRGLVYSVYSGISAYADAGAFQLYAGTQPEHADEVIGLMQGELRKLVTDGVTEDELDVARGYLTGAFELGLEDTGARMARNGGLLVTSGSIRPIPEQVQRWAAVDADAVAAVIERVYTAPPVVVTVGPTSS
jgi:predicted Zn-dependent peptidase